MCQNTHIHTQRETHTHTHQCVPSAVPLCPESPLSCFLFHGNNTQATGEKHMFLGCHGIALCSQRGRRKKKFLKKKGNKEISFGILSPAHNSPIDVLWITVAARPSWFLNHFLQEALPSADWIARRLGPSAVPSPFLPARVPVRRWRSGQHNRNLSKGDRQAGCSCSSHQVDSKTCALLPC